MDQNHHFDQQIIKNLSISYTIGWHFSRLFGSQVFLCFLDGLHSIRIGRGVEDRGARHDGVAACVLDLLGIAAAGTTVDLDPRVHALLFAHLLEVPGRKCSMDWFVGENLQETRVFLP